MDDRNSTQNPQNIPSDLFSFVVSDNWHLSVEIDTVPLAVILAVAGGFFLVWRLWSSHKISDFEIDGAEFGVGKFKMKFKPNDVDRQIAYSIWVELSTRKIGLPIDLDNDVIVEVYDSWYSFFGVTRELVKEIPVSKVRSDSTSKIVRLSIEVLNLGLRPHLTKWQAKYRRWYEQQIEEHPEKSPQEIQRGFPDYRDLCADLLEVNKRLMHYCEKMDELVSTK